MLSSGNKCCNLYGRGAQLAGMHLLTFTGGGQALLAGGDLGRACLSGAAGPACAPGESSYCRSVGPRLLSSPRRLARRVCRKHRLDDTVTHIFILWGHRAIRYEFRSTEYCRGDALRGRHLQHSGDFANLPRSLSGR